MVCSSVSKILALFRRLREFSNFCYIPRSISSAWLWYVLNWQTWKISGNNIPAPFATFDSYLSLIDIFVWLSVTHSNQCKDKENILEVCSEQINSKIYLSYLKAKSSRNWPLWTFSVYLRILIFLIPVKKEQHSRILISCYIYIKTICLFCFLMYADKMRIWARKSINEKKTYLTAQDNCSTGIKYFVFFWKICAKYHWSIRSPNELRRKLVLCW